MHDLAIVIPAYKDRFLAQALTSLSNQTCLNFTVYIGDDASPYDIYSIVAQYESQLKIVYHRFSENLGGVNLVGQWERCVALSQSEPWIWLFSDDDEMEPNCVESFYAEIGYKKEFDLYHFNVDVIDSKSQYTGKRSTFPSILTVQDFTIGKLRGRYSSFVVEYIFSRQIYNTVGGFQLFDLAWNADDATWIKMGQQQGIKTIKGAKVRWRTSTENISPNNSSPMIVHRKLKADVEYTKWLCDFLGKSIRLQLFLSTWMCVNFLKCRNVISPTDIRCYMIRTCKAYGGNRFAILFMWIYYYYKLLTE